jgi:long-chain acyl-CoA synthetase
VMVRDGATIGAEDIKAFCLDKGPAYSHPRFVDIVPALPLNGAGKVDRGIVQAKLTAAYGGTSAAANSPKA